VFQKERRHIFARNWHLIGRSEQLAKPGDYVTGDVAGWPVFAVLDRDGGLRAFHNVCRHRAGPLFDDAGGHCQTIRCLYHGWMYGFDGGLRTAPGFPETGALEKSRFGLFPVRVDTWRGLLFVCLDPEAPPLDAWMGDVAAQSDPFPAITDFAFHSLTTYEGQCNWKTYGDNSCEGYHLPFIHGGLNKAVATADIRAYENGGFVGFDIGYSGEGDVRAGKGLWPEGDQKFGDDYVADSRAVIAEDMGVCERVQKNLDAGLYTSGKLSAEKEPGTIFFQQRIREAMDLPPVELGNSV